MSPAPDPIAALAARLQAQRKGYVLPERYRPRPNFDHLDDPDLWRRLTADVEGDDGEVMEAVKARGKRRQVFRERDITRAIAGTLKAGLAVAGTKIAPDGSIVVITGAPEKIDLAPIADHDREAANEWDTPL